MAGNSDIAPSHRHSWIPLPGPPPPPVGRKRLALVKTNPNTRPIRDADAETLKARRDVLMRGVDIMVGLKSQVEEVFLHFLLIS